MPHQPRLRGITLGFPWREVDVQQLRGYLLDLYTATGLPSNFSTVETTNATETTIEHFPLEDETSYLLTAQVLARRTGGSAGSSGDSAGYVRRAVVRRTGAGSATLIGSVQDAFTAESVSGYNCTIDVSGNDARVRVTGAADTNISWSCFLTTQRI